jgi:hypothetical protein
MHVQISLNCVIVANDLMQRSSPLHCVAAQGRMCGPLFSVESTKNDSDNIKGYYAVCLRLKLCFSHHT